MPFIADILELATELADQLGAKGNCSVDYPTSCKMGGRTLCRNCRIYEIQDKIRRAVAIEKFLKPDEG